MAPLYRRSSGPSCERPAAFSPGGIRILTYSCMKCNTPGGGAGYTGFAIARGCFRVTATALKETQIGAMVRGNISVGGAL